MEQRTNTSANPPRKGRTAPPATFESWSVDRVPKTPAEWQAFAALPADARAAAYLKSIRQMLGFFTVLAVLAIIATVVFGLIGIHAVDQIHSTSNPFG